MAKRKPESEERYEDRPVIVKCRDGVFRQGGSTDQEGKVVPPWPR